jgi:hypothetical protein
MFLGTSIRIMCPIDRTEALVFRIETSLIGEVQRADGIRQPRSIVGPINALDIDVEFHLVAIRVQDVHRMRNAVIALPEDLHAMFTASRFGVHQGCVIFTDAPTGMVEADAMPLHGTGCIPNFQQEKFVMGTTTAQGRGPSTKGCPDHIQSDDSGVKLNHVRH